MINNSIKVYESLESEIKEMWLNSTILQHEGSKRSDYIKRIHSKERELKLMKLFIDIYH